MEKSFSSNKSLNLTRSKLIHLTSVLKKHKFSTCLPTIRMKTWTRELLREIKKGEIDNFLIIAPRQSNKDITALLCAREYLHADKANLVYYIAHYHHDAREIIFDNKLEDGEPMYSLLGFVKPIKSSSMLVSPNGSIFQVFGCDRKGTSLNGSSHVGKNCAMIIFTEFALQDPTTWVYLSPTLGQRKIKTKIIIISTPRQRNHLYDLYQSVKDDPTWYVRHMSMYDLPDGEYNIQEAIKCQKIMTQPVWRQEFLCDFDVYEDETFYYLECLGMAKKDGRICEIDVPEGSEVYTAWDLGYTDNTVIIFFTIDIYGTVYIFDMIEKNNKGLMEYAYMVKDRGYNYVTHFLPHDGGNEYLTDQPLSAIDTLKRRFRELGMSEDIRMVGKRRVNDGIKLVRDNFYRFIIDPVRCEPLIRGLHSYRKHLNPTTKTYGDLPATGQECRHRMDALRYLATALESFQLGER